MTSIDTNTAAFMAGLVTSVHCVGMCGPLSCSWAIQGREGGFWAATGLYHGGRLFSYALIGAVAGAIGYLPLKFFHQGAGLVLPWLMVLAFTLVGLGADAWLPKPMLLSSLMRRFQGMAFRLKSTSRAGLLGLGTPLLPCGPLYVIFALALANGSVLKGASFAVSFGLGTLPLLWLAQSQLNWLGGRLQPATMRKLQRALALGAALVMAYRLRGTWDLAPDELPSCCHPGAE